MMENLKNNWYYVLAVVVLVAILSWLAPAYKKSVKDRENLTTQISDLQTRLIVASTTKTSSKTYFPDGHLASETSSETDTHSSEDKHSHSNDSLAVRSHEEITTKRGLLSALVYVDLNQNFSGSASYQVLPPISIGALYSHGTVSLGLGLSF